MGEIHELFVLALSLVWFAAATSDLIFIEVSETASAKMASAIDVRIDDVGSILKFSIGFPFGDNSAAFSAAFLQVHVDSGVDAELPYRVRIVDRGFDCRDPVRRHHFRFQILDPATVRLAPCENTCFQGISTGF